MDLSLLPFLGALAWKSSLVLALASALSRLLARRSAALRHGVWTLAVLALIGLPVVQALAPPLAAPWLSPFSISTPGASVAKPASVGRPRTGTTGDGMVREVSPGPARVAAGATGRSVLPSWPGIVLIAWLAGAVAVFSYFAAGKVALARMARRACPLEDEVWRSLAAEVAEQLGVRGPLRFLVAEDTTSPLTWGVLAPTILLPASAADWPIAQRRSFLVHELAHVARRDCAIQEAAHVACALYWFHPGVWYAAHRLRVEREQACDDLVLADGASAEAYARQLLDVVRAGRAPRGALSLSGAAMAAPSQLEARVRALVDGTRDRRRIGRGRAILGSALGLALLLPLATVVPAATGAARRATEKAAPASSSGGGLDERWQRALEQGPPGGAGRAFWFAYAIEFDGGRDGKETLLSDSEGWNAADLENRGITLAERLGCGDRDAVLLFRVPAGARAFDRVAVRSARLSPDLGGLPVIAVGPVPLDESLDWLVARLDEAPADRRAAVLVTALALHDTPRTEPLLEDILEGPQEDIVRVQAAEGLARHPGASALATLAAHARSDASQDVRRESAEAVGDLAYGPATDALIALSREIEDEIVRAEAVESLGAREPGRVVPVLVSVANEDGVEMVRREAVETLGDLPGNAGLEALRRMAMGHRDPAVRSEAVETLNEMGLRAEHAAQRR